jgi:hypothetical protein
VSGEITTAAAGAGGITGGGTIPEAEAGGAIGGTALGISAPPPAAGKTGGAPPSGGVTPAGVTDALPNPGDIVGASGFGAPAKDSVVAGGGAVNPGFTAGGIVTLGALTAAGRGVTGDIRLPIGRPPPDAAIAAVGVSRFIESEIV